MLGAHADTDDEERCGEGVEEEYGAMGSVGLKQGQLHSLALEFDPA